MYRLISRLLSSSSLGESPLRTVKALFSLTSFFIHGYISRLSPMAISHVVGKWFSYSITSSMALSSTMSLWLDMKVYLSSPLLMQECPKL